MKRFLLSIGISLCFLGASYGQTQILIEDFEDGTVEYTTSVPEFTDGSGDYFQRTTSPSESFTNIQGSGIFEAMDLDGEGAILPLTITFDDINISGFSGLELRVFLAEGDDGSNQDWDASDYVHFDYDIDNTGSFSNLLHIESSGASNTVPAIDTNFDGSGDGTEITNAFTQFTKSISGTGSLLDIKITLRFDSGDEDIAFDNIEIYGTAAGGTPTKLAVTDINGGNSPSSGTGFDVVVELQDADDNAVVASQDTSVTLSLGTGTGSLAGTLTGTISSGSATGTISGVIHNTAESGVTITATNTGGSLTSGTSESFEVLESASKLVIKDFPSTGNTDVALSEFTVEVQRADDSIDENSSISVAISKESGTGSLGGTTSVSAVDGIATFSDITFDAADDYTVTVSATGLTSATSGTVTISTIVTPSAGTVFITEVADADNDFNAEFIELYNSGSDAVSLETADLVMYDASGSTPQTTFDIENFTGSTIIPANGFLIIARGATEAEFVTEWGALESNTNYNVGSSAAFFGTGRRWVLKQGSSLVDSTTTGVGNNRDFQFPIGSGIFITGDQSEATPGELDGESTIDGSAGWRLLSMPITGGTIADISDDTPVQGVSGGDDENAEDANVIIYGSSAVYDQPTNVSTAWGDGYGFGLYFYDNTDNGSSELPVTLGLTGTEPSTDVTVSLNSGSSNLFTLVGNPFSTNYHTQYIQGLGGNFSNNLTFWDNGSSSYIVRDRTLGTGFVASPWQGFWVETVDATITDISFPTSGKTTSDTTATYFKSSERRADLRFSLTSATTRDEALRLSVRQDASLGYDLDDAGKLMPLLSEFATMAFNSPQGLKAVESLPFDLQEEVTLELEPQLVGVSGTFTFAWKGMESMPAEWEIILHDYDSGANIDMRDNSEYVFTAQAEAKSKTNPLSLLSGPVATPMRAKATSGRFGITLRPTSVHNETEDAPVNFALEQNYPNPFNPSTTITYSVQEAGAVNISVYNLMGQKVATLVDETKAAGSYNIRWNAAGSASGMYYYRLEAGGQSITRKMTLIK